MQKSTSAATETGAIRSSCRARAAHQGHTVVQDHQPQHRGSHTARYRGCTTAHFCGTIIARCRGAINGRCRGGTTSGLKRCRSHDTFFHGGPPPVVTAAFRVSVGSCTVATPTTGGKVSSPAIATAVITYSCCFEQKRRIMRFTMTTAMAKKTTMPTTTEMVMVTVN